MRRAYGEGLFEVHQAVIKAFEELTERDGVSCALVTEIEKLARKDPRTVWAHLKLMEMDKYGHFVSNGKMFQSDRWKQ